ncbi:hypothetical protein GCM10010401_10480 [Rarobacter faecitabidus]|uniref:Putative membrane protein insertion efficiency factor n=2 Tax=Rarobacter faecitabidus TaxID=13243 RepID=A0A542ZPR7_RARFA|nr:membrane protein insertion efficiency factor YidD [Rarobacter faecitabidus]TQL62210.1 hypothetical protein FB461_1851 [Rarobacter faecitabidus]
MDQHDGPCELVHPIRSSRGRGTVAVIRWYQRKISPYLGPRCRYYPTCSAYALGAIERHGLIKGITLGAWRLAKCNQFSSGGIDDVPEKFRLSFRGYDSHAGIETNERESDDDARVKE